MAAEPGQDAADSYGSAVRILNYSSDPRHMALLALCAFWSGEQHDNAPASWEGVPRAGNAGYLLSRSDYGQPASTNLNADAWSYGQRRPNTSAAMSRRVTTAFTDALLGRTPQLSTPSDPRTARFLAACWEACDGWAVLTEARNYAGTLGSAALVVVLVNGELALDAYWAHEIHVLDWCDSAGWKPRRAIYQTTVSVEQDPDDDGNVCSKQMVRTKEWDEQFVTLYEDVPRDHEGPIPIASRRPHNMGRCPVVWLQNTRNTREPEGTYDMQTQQVLELSDRLDRVQSFAVRATQANASPTLYRKDHMHWLQRGPVRKGHGAEITGTPDGDAKFLESAGEGVTNSWETARRLEMQILQATSCVLPDMSWALSNISYETLALLMQSMDSRCALLQTPLQRCIKEICEIFRTLGLGLGVLDIETAGDTETGLRLPPYVETIEPEDEDEGGEPKVITAPHEVGKARHVVVVWPPRQLLAPEQLLQFTTALNGATAGGLLSKESGVEALASARGQVDADSEKRRIKAENAKGRAALMAGGLSPGLPGDQQAADDEVEGETDDEPGDADGDGIINEGTPQQRSVE